ncbi:MAG: tetratricopeptide repeat protein [Deltaproteobacteria bacterium]|nr:tetratricopeptide repeat protein [Deltaproteobacteria bacterium]
MGLLYAALLLWLGAATPALAARSPRVVEPLPSLEEQVTAVGLSADVVIFPFETTPEMEAWARKATRMTTTPLDRLEALQLALFNPRTFAFTYDRAATLTAREAFTTHRGNCLAFTSLFIALARSVGVDARMVSVQRVVDVSLEDDLVVLTRHVVAGYEYMGRMHLYDFTFEEEAPALAYAVVDDRVASSMLHGNRGAASLLAGQVAEAQVDLEIATRLTPERPTAWVNLGVARRRGGDLVGAIDAYKRSLELDAGNGAALANLAVAYRLMGRPAEAEIALRAAAEDRISPFSQIALADAERSRGDLESALRLLRRARRNYPRVPEVHEGLARWAHDAGNPERASRHGARAERLHAKVESLRAPAVASE